SAGYIRNRLKKETPMEFAVIAYDGKDADAPARRQAVREAHMEVIRGLRQQGHMIHGGALLDDDGNMIGSIIISDFPTREAFDAWYQNDPYITGNVWQDVQIVPFRTAPSFVGNIPPKPESAASV